MKTETTVVLQSKGRGARLLSQYDELARLGARGLEVLVVDTGEIDRISRSVRNSLASSGNTTIVSIPPGLEIGAARNAALEATTTELVLFVDPGFSIAPSYLEIAQAEFAASESLGFVTCWLDRLLPGSETEVVSPSEISVQALLGDPEAVHPCTIFRSSLLRRLGGFQTDLSCFEIFEAALQMLAAGSEGRAVQKVLVTESTEESGYRADLERHRNLSSMTKIFKRHRSVFEAYPEAVLLGRDRRLHELAPIREELLVRRKQVVLEHESLKQEIDALIDELSKMGEDRLDWGELRRTRPLSPDWGYDRGTPIDRRYIEEFLESFAEDIRGTVLEVQESDYTYRFGADRVLSSHVVDQNPDNRRANVQADLRHATDIPSDRYDCVILTQTVHVIDDMPSVVRECYRILKPAGTLLMTLPSLSRVCLEYGPEGDYWRLTEAGARALLYEAFPSDGVETRVYGNVLVATAFLYGLATDELNEDEYADTDPFNPVLIGARAVKPNGGEAAAMMLTPRHRGVILGYHRVGTAASDVHSMCVTPEQFQVQMEHLARTCSPLPLPELLERAQAADLPPRAVAVTLDDGYLDALTEATPILLDLDLPATFFISVEAIESGRAFWWDRLEKLLLSGATLPDEIGLYWKAENHRFDTSNEEARQHAHEKLYSIFLRCPPAQRDDLERQLEDWAPQHFLAGPDQRALNPSELVRLADSGLHTIGAHSRHHLALSHQSFETQQREIFESKNALERLVGKPVSLFAYPFGDVSDTAVDLVRAASYQAAVTCEPAAVEEWPDPYRLPRWGVPADPELDFGVWLANCYGADP